MPGRPPAFSLPVPFYTPGWREAFDHCESKVTCPKTQRNAAPGLKPGPLDPACGQYFVLASKRTRASNVVRNEMDYFGGIDLMSVRRMYFVEPHPSQ